MKTTLKQLRQWNACKSGYTKVAGKWDEGDVIPVVEILDTNDIQDTIWVLYHDTDTYKFQTLIIDIAGPMAQLNTDPRVAQCIQALKDYRDNKIGLDKLHTASAIATAGYASAAAAAAGYATSASADYAAEATASADYVAAYAASAAASAAIATAGYASAAAAAGYATSASAAATAEGSDGRIRNLIKEYCKVSRG